MLLPPPTREMHSNFSSDPPKSPMAHKCLEDRPIPSDSPMQDDYRTNERSNPVASTHYSIPPCPHSAVKQVSYAPDTSTNLTLTEDKLVRPYYNMPPIADTQKETGYESDALMKFHPSSWNLQAPGADDTSLEDEPSVHVDYLSHGWREEDIWSSWRYVVRKKNVYRNKVRLENASWRIWAKTKDNLGTISPESLDW